MTQAAAALPFPAISVNGVTITRAAIAREIQHHPAENTAAAWKEAAQALVIRQLLLDRAHGLGLTPTPQADDQGRRETDEEALMRQVIEAEAQTPTPDAETCRRYYDQNRKRFRAPDIFEADHILLAADPADADKRRQAQSAAIKIIAILRQQPHRFAELAQTYSACPSAGQGGNLGQMTRGTTVPEFEQAMMAMNPGEIGETPCETRYGFHVIRLIRRIEGDILPFDMVSGRIASYLTESVNRQAIHQYVSILAGAANITGFSI